MEFEAQLRSADLANSPETSVAETSPRVVLDERYQQAHERLGDYLIKARQDPEKRILYEEQVPVMESLYRFLGHYGRDLKGYISLPTGAGKTVLFTEFIRATGLRTLVVTPTQLLLKQTEAAFGKFAGDNDISIGKVFANEKDGSKPITITTYASLVRHTKDKDSPFLNPSEYDVIILDEAHRALGNEATKALKSYPDTVLIGLTATEDYSKKKKLSSLLPHLVHKMSIKEAVYSGLICPFSVWVVETETDMSKVRVGLTNEYDQHDLQYTINTLARNQMAVELYIKHFMGKKAIFSCSGVEHAKTIAAMFNQAGVPAEATHGGLTLRRQQQIKARIEDPNPSTGIFILSNDKIVGEGFDVAQLEVAFNLAPTLSLVRCQQRSGRALRLNPDNLNKQAVIIEFIDKNYVKPPVLFADQAVAGTAHTGRQLDLAEQEQTYVFNLASARVITNPEIVEQLALTFDTIRKENRPPAPEGWLTMSGLNSKFNVPVSIVSAAMKRLKANAPEIVAENSGKFTARGVKNGVTTYYSPVILDQLEGLIERPEVAPSGWMTSAQIGARYSLDYNNSHRRLLEAANTLYDRSQGTQIHSGEYVEGADSAKRKFYFSPECVLLFAKRNGKKFLAGNQVPESWVSRKDLESMFGPNASQQALKAIDRSSMTMMFNNSLTLGEQQYFSPSLIDRIVKWITPPRGWKNINVIAGELGVDKELIGAAIKSIEYSYKERLCWVDGQEIVYYPPLFPMNIKQALEKLETTKAEFEIPSLIDMTEDVPVLIPQFQPTPAPVFTKDILDSIEFTEFEKSEPTTSEPEDPLTGHAPAHGPPGAYPYTQTEAKPTPTFSYLSAMRRFRRS